MQLRSTDATKMRQSNASHIKRGGSHTICGKLEEFIPAIKRCRVVPTTVLMRTDSVVVSNGDLKDGTNAHYHRVQNAIHVLQQMTEK